MPDLRMPAEWEPHQRTWMAFPTPNPTFETAPDLEKARTAWSRVANTIVNHEPVTMLVDPSDRNAADAALDPRIDIAEVPIDDAWLRDSGPTFVLGDGKPMAVNWQFNGWGAQSWARWENDALAAEAVATLAGAEISDSGLTQEGGAFHVDGAGTVLLTETVQLDPDRNPGWTREQVEDEIHAQLGTTRAIWLPRGLTADYGEFGTRGHVDIVAAFTGAGSVLVHTQPDPSHPDHEVSLEVTQILRDHDLDVIPLLAPETQEVDGELVDYSYVNHYVANGVVVACGFADPRDDQAKSVLESVYPDRRVISVDARDIFAFGGGIHCITQQQPDL